MTIFKFVKLLNWLGLLLACVVVSGCAGSSDPGTYTHSGFVPTTQAVSDVMRVGDKITIRLSGTPDNGYIMELQIPESGQITVPYLTQPFQAAGRTPGQLAAEITQAYKTQGIYTTPNVTVIPEERYVSVGGEVRSPTRVLYAPDLTVLGAINSCGGFTDYAKRNSVRVIRGSQVIYVDCARAASHPGVDIPVYPGDQIVVQRTIF